MLTLGRDYNYVRDEIDLIRLKALNAYQREYPPTNIGVQRLCRILEAFAGIEDNPKKYLTSEDDEEDLLDVLANFPQGG
ncbi:hypothetical protein F892_01713 [Acinetobacter vivianii]|uniref:Uncharacterized protein n=1 Tax=Acinetobacter vivianii TaxID=1776742 RepID=N9PXR7_9GAMM|nr:hypothetical protein [Acinetobacter vivianii]ENX22471.1 hypothetical protein F892_01713 [Acinetobacter vivianii]